MKNLIRLSSLIVVAMLASVMIFSAGCKFGAKKNSSSSGETSESASAVDGGSSSEQSGDTSKEPTEPEIPSIGGTDLVITASTGETTAVSYWFTEYVDAGVLITAKVIDDSIYDGADDYAYNDGVAFGISLKTADQALDTKYAYKFTMDVKGRYSLQKAVSATAYGAKNDLALNMDPGYNYYCSVTKNVEWKEGTGTEYKVYLAYSLLNTDKAHGLGNMTFCPVHTNAAALGLFVVRSPENCQIGNCSTYLTIG